MGTALSEGSRACTSRRMSASTCASSRYLLTARTTLTAQSAPLPRSLISTTRPNVPLPSSRTTSSWPPSKRSPTRTM